MNNYKEKAEKIIERMFEKIKINGEIEEIDEISEEIKRNSKELMQEYLEEIEEQIFKSWRRKSRYESKGKELRKIITMSGEIRYHRRRYVDRYNGETVYLLDVLIGVRKRQKYSDEVKKRAIKNSLELSSFREAGKKLLEQESIEISKSSVNKWARECTFKEKEVKKREAKVITISVDGTYPHIKEGSMKELKVANIYDEREKVGKNKYKINSLIYSSRRQTEIKRYWEQVLEFIERTYEVAKIEKIYITGDGAGWIRRLLNDELSVKKDWTVGKKKEYVIDRFHYVNNIMYLEQNKYKIEQIKEYYKNGDASPFKKDKKMLEKLESSEYKDKYDYMERYEANTKAYSEADYLGCCMEMVMSHYICPRFKGRAKSWTKNIFKYSYGLCLLKNNMLEIELEKEEEKEYIEDIKFMFKDKQLYFGNYKDECNVPELTGRGDGINYRLNNLIHHY